MARVVYFLGAGFSQPMGVPTLGEFIQVARDQQQNRDEFSYFGPLLEQIEGLHKAGSFFKSDLSNIEEVLSLLEADAFVNDQSLKERFKKLVCDVIKYHTPPIQPVPGKLPSNWQGLVFGGREPKWNEFGYFTLALLNLQLFLEPLGNNVKVSPEPNPATTYSVVTTNYDCVLENVCEYINGSKLFVTDKDKVGFHVVAASRTQVTTQGRVVLAKLHGSVANGEIIPPTWSKAPVPDFRDPWLQALKALSEAQEIRMIGYSLPESDSNVRYLLKSAAIRNRDLRRVDVICLDGNREQDRYNRFANFGGYKFRTLDTWQYLNNFFQRIVNVQSSPYPSSPSAALEATHAYFFKGQMI
ncbi:MAG TPA: SIR2 family protein [Gemmatimonadales bacterium]|nr:SIR2 family protein [Gemmatimonadales bacterium]